MPLFALANAGITLGGAFLARAYTSPVTLGILIGYVAGKPLGITGGSWLLTRLSRGRLRPPVGWAAVAGVGTIAGIGFAVSILIATLAFTGTALQEAKLGVLSTVVAAPAVTWLVFRATALLPARLQIRALLGTSEVITDLGAPVDPGRDHIRGPGRAPVTIVEYGDFECPYCGQAEPVVRELLAGHGDVRYVWRHLPLNDVHPHAQLAAEAAEAAAEQGAFWDMHDLLLRHQDRLQMRDLLRYATDLRLDTDRFTDHLRKHAGAARIAEDVDSADLSGVSGTPTFFINGRRHYGSYDIAALTAAVRAAKATRPTPLAGPGLGQRGRRRPGPLTTAGKNARPGRIGCQRCGCLVTGEQPCCRWRWSVAAGIDADVRVGADVAEPLGPGPEPGGHNVGARPGAGDDFQDDITPGARFPPEVFEHQQPRSEQEPQACPVEPDGRAGEPADPQQSGGAGRHGAGGR